MSTLKERAAARRVRMVTGKATSYEEAEAWDLAFWQKLTPADRLSAHVAILRDVALAQEASRIHEEIESGNHK